MYLFLVVDDTQETEVQGANKAEISFEDAIASNINLYEGISVNI